MLLMGLRKKVIPNDKHPYLKTVEKIYKTIRLANWLLKPAMISGGRSRHLYHAEELVERCRLDTEERENVSVKNLEQSSWLI